MPNQLKLSIVIVHWSAETDLHALLQRLTADNQTQLKLDLIVVDNASVSMASQKKLKANFPGVTWVWNAVNQGFSFACNQGLRKAQGDWTFFLNPDVELTIQDIQDLVSHAQKHGLSAVCPKPDAAGYQRPVPSFWSLMSEFSPLGKFFPELFFQHKTLVGGTLLIKTEVIKQIGGWDERFWLWFEDSDLTKRLLMHTIPYGFAPSKIQHRGAGSISKLENQAARDIFFTSLKSYSQKYFSSWQQLLLQLLVARFSRAHLTADTQPGLTVVVPNLKPELLDSFLADQAELDSEDIRFVIVSSALTTKTFWQLKAKYPKIRYIMLQKNRGFAATVNVGLRSSVTAWTGTMNDDAKLPANFKFDPSKYAATVAGVNPIILTPSGQVESAGIEVLPVGKARPVTNLPKSQTKTQAVNAAAVFFRAEALNQVGLFDPRFGSYLEDIDVSLRLRKKGWQLVVDPELQVTHQKHQTSQNMGKRKNWLDAKNWWLVLLKNWSVSSWIRFFPDIILERAKNLAGILK